MESENPQTLGSIATRIACTLLGLVLLYVLSLGPACFLYGRLGKGESVLEVVYAPLFLAARVMHLKRPMKKYAEWWRDLAPPR